MYYQHHYCFFDHRYCVYEINCFIIITDTGFELCHDGIKIEMLLSLANSPSKVGIDFAEIFRPKTARLASTIQKMLRNLWSLGFSYCIQLVNRRLEVHCNSSNDTLRNYLAFHSFIVELIPGKTPFDVFFFEFSAPHRLPFLAIRRPCALQTASWLNLEVFWYGMACNYQYDSQLKNTWSLLDSRERVHIPPWFLLRIIMKTHPK